MSPHPEELLQIYIILGPFASNRSETGEIPVILQDSLSGIVVHIELLYFCRISLTESACLEKSWSLQDFACRMGVSREMVQFSGWWKYPFSYSKLLSQQPDICRIRCNPLFRRPSAAVSTPRIRHISPLSRLRHSPLSRLAPPHFSSLLLVR
ncbi:hypothetical protein [Paenibacillus dendritiformis]|uniref:hypothetical protein n=1 Tax=Paenibacillus dendritiformis TaxID=130049 RepID=UPI001BCC65E4|nr:hypothetical protein [Paenibacillus dendritiformis]